MALNKEISLYQELKDYINKYGYKNYVKQGLKYAGELEAQNINFSGNNNNAQRISTTNTLIQFILDYINDDTKGRANLEFWINNCDVANIYYMLMDKLKILIKESIIKEDYLYKLGSELATKGKHSNEIKLGLSMLRLSNNDNAKEFYKIFSVHNEYVFYCLEGMKEYEGVNSFVFEVCKMSKGYGKYIAVSQLEPLTEEIRLWTIENGSDNDIYEEKLIDIVLSKVNIEWYIDTVKVTSKKFNILLKILKKIFQDEENRDRYYNYDLFYEYLMKFNKYGKKFSHIYGVMIIIYFIGNHSKEAMLGGKLTYKEVIKETSILEEEIKQILKNYKWINVVKEEITKGKEDINKIIEVALILDETLAFEDLLCELEKSPFNINIYRYIMEECDGNSKEDLIKFIIEKSKCNSEAYQNKDEYDLCMYYVIKNMKNMVMKYIGFNIESLKNSNKLIKEAALKNLIVNKDMLLIKELEMIREIYIIDGDKEFYKPLLNSINNGIEIKDIIEDVNELKVEPDLQDIYLISMDIEGLEYMNLSKVEEGMGQGCLVYLKLEGKTSYDEDKVKVISEQGWEIGYVPKNDSHILKSLLDAEKKLYGVIEEVKEDYTKYNVSIYLSRRDIEEEVNDILKMILVESEGLIS